MPFCVSRPTVFRDLFVATDWFQNCQGFLRAQIALVRPAVVVGLGQLAYASVLGAFEFRAGAFRASVENPAGVRLPTGSIALAVYHCGRRILNTHRDFVAQCGDWQRVGRALQQAERDSESMSITI
jgi:uracil-DNA glycosylase